MKYFTLKHFANKLGASIIIGFILVSVGVTGSVAQESPYANRQTHIHNADMSCCRCIPSEADSDPDVFKRPCFMKRLALSRQAFGITGIDLRESTPRIGLHHFQTNDIEIAKASIVKVVQLDALPKSGDDATFYGVAIRLKDEGQFIRHSGKREIDPHPIITELRPGDTLNAQWISEGIEFLPIVAGVVEPGRVMSRGIALRMRLCGDRRLDFTPRPPQSEFAAMGSIVG